MPFQHKSSRYQKRSHSSSEHDHRRERRTYEKQKSDRFEKYHRRSHSRSPPKDDGHKSKYTYHYQHKEQKRNYDHYRDTDKSKHYDTSYHKRDQFEKKDREKGDQYSIKLKYNRFDEKEPYRNREKQLGYQKRERGRNSSERDRKRRRSSSSRSRSSNRKQMKKPQIKLVYSKHSPPERYKQHDTLKRNKKSLDRQDEESRVNKMDEERAITSPRVVKPEAIKPIQSENQLQLQSKPIQSIDRNSPTILPRTDTQKQQKREVKSQTFFKLRAIPPPPKTAKQQQPQKQPIKKIDKQAQIIDQKVIKQEPASPTKRGLQQIKELRQQQTFVKCKASKFDLLLQQARQNLAVAPPKSSFFLLETFRTMNKFQVQTLDSKWMSFLKKDMEKYPQERQAVMCKLTESTSGEQSLICKQYVWMKEDRNEQELDLRFRFQEFKQHNANLNELFRKLRFLD